MKHRFILLVLILVTVPKFIYYVLQLNGAHQDESVICSTFGHFEQLEALTQLWNTMIDTVLKFLALLASAQ